MSINIVHGVNQMVIELEGLSVLEVQDGTKDALNLPSDIDAYVNCKRVGGDCVLVENDHLEFVRARGMKGAIHDFWTEEEIVALWGRPVFDELISNGLNSYREPVFVPKEVVRQLSALNETVNFIVDERIMIDDVRFTVDFEGEGSCQLGNTVSFRLLSRLARNPGSKVSLSELCDDVWDREDTNSATVRRRINELNKKLRDYGINSVSVRWNSHELIAVLLIE